MEESKTVSHNGAGSWSPGESRSGGATQGGEILSPAGNSPKKFVRHPIPERDSPESDSPLGEARPAKGGLIEFATTPPPDRICRDGFSVRPKARTSGGSGDGVAGGAGGIH